MDYLQTEIDKVYNITFLNAVHHDEAWISLLNAMVGLLNSFDFMDS